MQSGSGFGNLLLLALPLLLLGYLFWSQRRRSRELANLQDSLQVGNQVLTTSGMFAKIIAIEGDQATLEIAPGVRARFDKRAILRRVDGVADSSAER
ncbi:MAG TPA: preprotein translocase subunit YajC [Phycicoccus sp.]|jgi:preprotein translocase subunit YajC|nr:preprotein translocase subunit YajC [Phycicoccus sp.]HQK31471.1 preprotein translocase subunit YajC [Phycicoccus sp.]HQY96339.1 preprotein translocase subunit YajC [Phycicoccus sp.]HRA43922.1 preprotein translocase subunit YajC [Phycicoccus sp.]